MLLAAAVTGATLARGGSLWDAFLASVDALLQAGVDPAARRIGLTDAPAVLGADAWLAIRERHGLGAMMQAVQALQQAGIFGPGDTRRLARLILGLLYGAIEALPQEGPQVERALADTRRLVHTMLSALRCDTGAP